MAADAKEFVTWASMPRKDQLLILCFLRFVDPVVRISIVTYIYYQLKSLDPTKESGEIIRQAAYLQTSFTLAQCCSALFLSKIADSPRGGRKLVIMIGLIGTIFSVVCFGFISNFYQAMALRIIEGIFNGNTAIVRTMVSEVVREKRFQPRAFLLLPISFNVAVIVSPVMAGQLADLAGRFPQKFGHVGFLKRYPFAPPVLLDGLILFIALLMVFFFLEETLEPIRGGYDLGIAISSKIRSLIFGGKRVAPSRIASNEAAAEEELALMDGNAESPGTPLDEGDEQKHEDEQKPEKSSDLERPLATRHIFTWKMIVALITYSLQECHISSYNALWTSFLSDPVAISSQLKQMRLPFFFSGGAGLSSDEVAWSMSLVGFLGLPIQLFVYPKVNQKLGTVRMWRIFLVGFPLVYFTIPYIAAMPSTTPPPSGKHGVPFWSLVVLVQVLVVSCSTFVVPAQLYLTNESSSHPSALGRTHSIAFIVTGLVRTASSMIAGILYSYGSSHNMTGLAWWILSLVALSACLVSKMVK